MAQLFSSNQAYAFFGYRSYVSSNHAYAFLGCRLYILSSQVMLSLATAFDKTPLDLFVLGVNGSAKQPLPSSVLVANAAILSDTFRRTPSLGLLLLVIDGSVEQQLLSRVGQERCRKRLRLRRADPVKRQGTSCERAILNGVAAQETCKFPFHKLVTLPRLLLSVL